VDFNRNALAVVLNGNGIGFGIDGNIKLVHVGIALLVVGGINEDLIKDLVQAGGVGDGLVDDATGGGIQDEHGLGGRFGGSDVGIGTEEDVLQLSLLLVLLLDGPSALLASGGLGGDFGRGIIDHGHVVVIVVVGVIS